MKLDPGLIVAAAASLLLAQPLVAAPAKPRTDAERYVGKGMPLCLYEQWRGRSARLLESSDPVTINFSRAGLVNSDDTMAIPATCLGAMKAGGLKEFDMGGLGPVRSLLAEDAYLAANDRPLSIPQGAQEAVERSFVAQGEELQQARALAAFADCVTYHAPVESDALLRTGRATPEEYAAVNTLAPTLGQCLTQGQNLSLTASRVRALVADGLWSRSHYGTKMATAAPAAGGTGKPG